MADVQNNNQGFTLGIGSIFKWILGIGYIFLALGSFEKSIGTGVLSLICGLLVLPIVTSTVKNKLHFSISGPLKFILVLFLTLIAMGMYPRS